MKNKKASAIHKRAATLRKKNLRSLDEKIFSVLEKNSCLKKLLTEENKLDLTLTEIVDTETGEVMNDEQFLKSLQKMKPYGIPKKENPNKRTSYKEKFSRKR